ncbi:FecR family protein [Chitinophaga sp. S165]|uniref:FecR family protein n=1 Tax=Chitinophaga sp. S165 TaxID=2135462 RepID=UPI000D7153D6|nr:FecR family protein [Chitinophaga sp. S165]PWV56408.1 FecR family protein [Chitinophaga sp. S165]
MTEKDHYIAVLIVKYLDNSLNEAEEAELTTWINAEEHHRDLFTEMTDPQRLISQVQQFYAYDSDRISHKIGQRIPEFNAVPVRMRPVYLRKWGWAAAIAVLLMGGSYYWTSHLRNDHSGIASVQVNIEPGRQGAILTLADGREVVLDSLRNGIVASQSGASIVLSEGQLVYDPTAARNMDVQYNKMTTPAGRQFQVTLPDGSNVWLNAASSIRFPTSFAGNERRVEVTGEVYFDVVKNANQPFIVVVKDKIDIEVLGTSFNVNAYENERSIRATLINGSIRVGVPSTDLKKAVTLQHNQQAKVIDKLITVTDNQDPEKVLAWKNGLFNFDGANLEEVMRELERWYDIEVVYENGIPDSDKFIGEMTRQIALTDLLDILKRFQVDFRVEGRKLIVLNK